MRTIKTTVDYESRLPQPSYFRKMDLTHTKSRFPSLARHYSFTIDSAQAHFLSLFSLPLEAPKIKIPQYVRRSFHIEMCYFNRRKRLLKIIICRFGISAKPCRKVQESSFGSKTVSKPEVYFTEPAIWKHIKIAFQILTWHGKIRNLTRNWNEKTKMPKAEFYNWNRKVKFNTLILEINAGSRQILLAFTR